MLRGHPSTHRQRHSSEINPCALRQNRIDPRSIVFGCGHVCSSWGIRYERQAAIVRHGVVWMYRFSSGFAYFITKVVTRYAGLFERDMAAYGFTAP